MDEKGKLPDIGETVVCRVKQVLGYGAFVELVEYGNIKGFVHVSQVASRWVKNIRNHVKEGQVRAAKVLSINRDKGQIDLSLVKVSANAQRARIEEWKQLKRSRKLLEILAEEKKKSQEEAWEKVAVPLLESYDSLAEAFQNISLSGEEAAEGVDKAWVKPLVELVKKSVSVPEKTVSGVLTLRSFESDGVDVIKDVLKKAEAAGSGKVDVFYKGGGKYSLKATAHDFKAAEKLLLEAGETALKEMKSKGGEASFEKVES
jgi:translation initiation factor 2 subunit 1